MVVITLFENRENSVYNKINKLVDLGMNELSTGNKEKATSLFEDAIISYEKNFYNNTKKKLIKPSTMSREYSNILFKLGSGLIKAKEYKKGESMFKISVEINPVNYNAWFQKGLTEKFYKKNDNAITSFNKALKINNKNSIILLYIGECYLDKGDVGTAIKYYVRYAKEKKGTTIEDFQRILALDQYNYFALSGLAYEYEKKGMHDEATNIYKWFNNKYKNEKSINDSKEYQLSTNSKATYIQADDVNETQRTEMGDNKNNVDSRINTYGDKEKTNIDNIDNESALFYVLETLLANKNYDTSINLYNEYVKNKNLVSLIIKFTKLLSKYDKYDYAMDIIKNFVAMKNVKTENITNYEFWLLKGSIEYKLGKYDDATFSLNRCLKYNGNVADAWYLKGLIAISAKIYDVAIQFLKRALEIMPGYKEIYKNDERVKVIRDHEQFKKLLN